MKIIKSLIAAPHMERAQRKVLGGEYRSALTSLRKLASTLGVDLPSVSLPVRANVITLQASYWLMEAELALTCAKVLRTQLLSWNEGDLDNNKRYTVDYLCGFFEFCAGRFPELEKDFLHITDDINIIYGEYDLSKVSPSLIYEMPLGERKVTP